MYEIEHPDQVEMFRIENQKDHPNIQGNLVKLNR